jgi:hypothetical protein
MIQYIEGILSYLREYFHRPVPLEDQHDFILVDFKLFAGSIVGTVVGSERCSRCGLRRVGHNTVNPLTFESLQWWEYPDGLRACAPSEES